MNVSSINCPKVSFSDKFRLFKCRLLETIKSVRMSVEGSFSLCFAPSRIKPTSPAKVQKKYPLIVKHLPSSSENRETVRKIAELWEGIAQDKELQAVNQKESLIFTASRMVSRELAGKMRHLHEREGRIFVCYDPKDNEPQAIAFTEDHAEHLAGYSYLFVSLLVSHPKNIRSRLNKQVTEGAGTQMISHLVTLCLEENKEEIRLSSTPSALPFYKKLGFEPYFSQSDSNYVLLKKEKFINLTNVQAS